MTAELAPDLPPAVGRVPRRRIVALVTGVAVAGLLAGCTGGDDKGGTGESASSAATSRASSGAEAADGGTDGSASGAAVTVGGHDYTPVVQATVTVPNKPENTVDVGVVSLVAKGRSVELRVVMTPHLTGGAADGAVNVFEMFGNSVHPQLVDVDALTSYELLATAGKQLETDVVDARTQDGEPLLYQAWFPRPQGDPAAVDVWLHGSWPVFEDVPVTYED
jgi:hypothetical protein